MRRIPQGFKEIKNDSNWGNLVGPNFMRKLREMYRIAEHEHTNGLMSCAECVFLVLEYEDHLKYHKMSLWKKVLLYFRSLKFAYDMGSPKDNPQPPTQEK